MKRLNYGIFAVVIAVMLLVGFISPKSVDNSTINGAWKVQNGSVEEVLIFIDGYFMQTRFDKSQRRIIATRGGAYTYADNKLETTVEFSSQQTAEIGQTRKHNFRINQQRLMSDVGGSQQTWTFVDDGKGPMVGVWRHSGRMQDGKLALSPPRARKTIKILSGNRYQWAAINAETKEFFGTGGGSYVYANGKYTETLDFFTKDSTKVGNSLTFDGKIEGDLWHHSGKSSQGADMYEIWRMEPKR